MTDINVSEEAAEDEFYSLARELVEHWQLQSATAKKNGDAAVAAQFGCMAHVVTKLIFKAKRAEAELATYKKLAPSIKAVVSVLIELRRTERISRRLDEHINVLAAYEAQIEKEKNDG